MAQTPTVTPVPGQPLGPASIYNRGFTSFLAVVGAGLDTAIDIEGDLFYALADYYEQERLWGPLSERFFRSVIEMWGWLRDCLGLEVAYFQLQDELNAYLADVLPPGEETVYSANWTLESIPIAPGVYTDVWHLAPPYSYSNGEILSSTLGYRECVRCPSTAGYDVDTHWLIAYPPVGHPANGDGEVYIGSARCTTHSYNWWSPEVTASVQATYWYSAYIGQTTLSDEHAENFSLRNTSAVSMPLGLYVMRYNGFRVRCGSSGAITYADTRPFSYTTVSTPAITVDFSPYISGGYYLIPPLNVWAVPEITKGAILSGFCPHVVTDPAAAGYVVFPYTGTIPAGWSEAETEQNDILRNILGEVRGIRSDMSEYAVDPTWGANMQELLLLADQKLPFGAAHLVSDTVGGLLPASDVTGCLAFTLALGFGGPQCITWCPPAILTDFVRPIFSLGLIGLFLQVVVGLAFKIGGGD